jgi:oxygen-independent coproporphyrinogen-3 oxidase
MSPDLVKRYAAPVPRYTSYPTAPHFTAAVGASLYADWLSALPPDSDLSLYLHVPFCAAMCWYCGCSTKATQRYEPVRDYLAVLKTEMAMVAERLPAALVTRHVHWGGGSPNILSPDDIRDLATATRRHFNLAADAEFAVEIDPRGLDDQRIAAFAEAGVTRVSIGVQDFSPRVQKAINRVQSFASTRDAVDQLRASGVNGVNIDLVYGLPHQTRESIAQTADMVVALKPDRVAAFGYAHLPARARQQSMIDDADLPDAVERFGQASRLARILTAAGYVRIGIDHFARPDDPLAQRPLKRNFQGYTDDDSSTLVGLGASSIGRLPQGYVQNAVATADYARRIGEGALATVRGVQLTTADRMRALVIERLMCDFAFPDVELADRFGPAALPLIEEAQALLNADADRIVEADGQSFRVTERGRPFVRSIAACFDAYLGAGSGTHASGI